MTSLRKKKNKNNKKQECDLMTKYMAGADTGRREGICGLDC